MIAHFKVQNVRNPHREKIGKYKCDLIHRIFSTGFKYLMYHCVENDFPLISQNNNDCGVFTPITSHNRSVSDIFLDSHKPPTTHIKFTRIVII